jgi:hypothetical protein
MENTDSLLFFIFESISSWKHMFLQASHDSMSMKNTLQFFLAMIHLVDQWELNLDYLNQKHQQ